MRFLIDNKILRTMGCSDSKNDVQNQQKLEGESKNKENRAKFGQKLKNTRFNAQQEEKNDIKQKKSPKNIIKDQGRSTNIDKVKVEKENVTKIKKAKELQTKPEHQKFISDIVSKSRGKLAAMMPPAQVSPKGFSKPVVEYSPKKKGDIFSKQIEKDYNRNRWQRPINQQQLQTQNNVQLNKSYIAVNQTIKSPYKQKQIQRKLNQIRYQSSELGKSKMKKLQRYENFRQ